MICEIVLCLYIILSHDNCKMMVLLHKIDERHIYVLYQGHTMVEASLRILFLKMIPMYFHIQCLF